MACHPLVSSTFPPPVSISKRAAPILGLFAYFGLSHSTHPSPIFCVGAVRPSRTFSRPVSKNSPLLSFRTCLDCFFSRHSGQWDTKSKRVQSNYSHRRFRSTMAVSELSGGVYSRVPNGLFGDLKSSFRFIFRSFHIHKTGVSEMDKLNFASSKTCRRPEIEVSRACRIRECRLLTSKCWNLQCFFRREKLKHRRVTQTSGSTRDDVRKPFPLGLFDFTFFCFSRFLILKTFLGFMRSVFHRIQPRPVQNRHGHHELRCR